MRSYVSRDGALRFQYPSPWVVDEDSPEYVSLSNAKPGSSEIAARAAAGDYTLHDGEAKVEIYIGERLDLLAEKSNSCSVEGTTIKVHECAMIELGGKDALWVLLDHSNDGDCTCREMIINGSKAGYRLSGGGCIGCSQTRRMLREIDAIFRTARIR